MLHYAKLGTNTISTIKTQILHDNLILKDKATYMRASKVILKVLRKKCLLPKKEIKNGREITTMVKAITQKYISTVAAMLINADIKIKLGKIAASEEERLLDILKANWKVLGINPAIKEKFEEMMEDANERKQLLEILRKKEALHIDQQKPRKNNWTTFRLKLSEKCQNNLTAIDVIKNYSEKGKYKDTISGREWKRKIDSVFANDQGRLFKYWNSLSPEKQDILLDQIKDIDFAQLRKNFIQAKFIRKATEKESFINLTPQKIDRTKAINAGIRALKKTIFIIFTGGDSSRFTKELLDILLDQKSNKKTLTPHEEKLREEFLVRHPKLKGKNRTQIADAITKEAGWSKHSFSVTGITKESTLELVAAKILFESKFGHGSIPATFVIGGKNGPMLRRFFRERNLFGLNELTTDIAEQKKIPMLDTIGKIILENKHLIGYNPNGTLGALCAPLQYERIITKWQKMEAAQIVALSADDVLPFANPDTIPYWIGFHVLRNRKLSVITFPTPVDKQGKIVDKFGKILVEEKNNQLKIVEFVDQSSTQQQTPGDVNAGVYIINFKEYLKLKNEAAKFPYHLSEPKEVHTKLGTQLAGKLELWAPDIVTELGIDPRSIGIIPATEDETLPIKNVKRALKIRRLLQKLWNERLASLRIHHHEDEKKHPLEIKEFVSNPDTNRLKTVKIDQKNRIILPDGPNIVWISRKVHERQVFIIEYKGKKETTFTVKNGKTETHPIKPGERIRIIRS